MTTSLDGCGVGRNGCADEDSEGDEFREHGVFVERS
jgi:hypothetical protein